MRVRAICLAALALCACGNTHPLLSGTYAFALTEVIKDECAQAGRADLMSGGKLVSYGNEVRFDYGFYDLHLVGVYLNSVERMRLDGSSANLTTTLNGIDCLLDLVVVTLDSTTLDPTHFEGAIAVKYEASRNAECQCETWVRFAATRTGNP